MNKLGNRLKAVELRKRGFGINEISKRLGIGKNTISLWCRGIELTKEQKDKFKRRVEKLARIHHRQAMERRIKENQNKIASIEASAKKEIGRISQRETFLMGIALYWAEGFKHPQEKALGFSNSDPRLVRFYVNWLRGSLRVDLSDISLRVTTNISLRKRVRDFERFWSALLKIPQSQFTKPFFQRTKQKKVYPKGRRYYGVLRIRVRKSSLLFKKMGGWLKALS